MTQQRLTATSIANLQVADSVGFLDLDSGGVAVWVQRASSRSYLSGSRSVMAYPDQKSARRAIKRIRPDLEPTTI